VLVLTGITVLQGYGLTEASPLTHLNPPYKGLVKRESAGIGVSDQGQKIVYIEDGKKERDVRQVGELIVSGPHVMKGYWKGEQETAETIRDGWLYTGDIARLDEDGYIYIVDRKKEMIKYKGFSVAPAEIEAVLFEHDAVADCAVIGRPDPDAGEVPKALVVPKEGEKIDPQALLDFVAQRVAGYKKLRDVEFVDQIPKNPSGKILRRVLKERERQKT
jgi:long-chain acyl-CoA synthetase